MLTVLSCIVVDHNPVFTVAAVLVCLTGSLLTMRLFARARHTRKATRFSWLALGGIIGGATIWTTHFVAMMGYKAGVVVGYEPVGTLSSLAIAIAVTSAGFLISTVQQRGALIEAGGVIMGLGIAAMHYTGMDAYEVQGLKQWDANFVLASLIAGAFLGAVATNRIGRPVTRFCKYGGAAAMILAIASTHFIGMAGLTIVPMADAVVPANVVPEGVLIVVVVAIMMMILALGAASYFIDMQSTRASAERYRHLSMHDALTGLPNRVSLMEHLGEALEMPAGRSPKIAILSFDLDRFKEINDVHGHAAGDHVLRAISERMSGVLNDDEFLARVGGDEFVAIKTRYFTRSDAMHFSKRLIDQISRPIEWKEQIFLVGSSVGISIYPDSATTIDDLLAQSDVAMYRAKSTGSNNICFYDISMDSAARERNALAMDLRTALQQRQFELYYQRQNETASGKVIGFEVLLRWNHPQRGRISPADFIPIAEKTGLINQIGDWVLEEACREAAAWGNPLSVAVNVAPAQLADAKFPQRVQEILQTTGLDPLRLELEITESGIIQDQQRALQTIRQLKDAGVRIAMDDYGTGYSSLSTLQLFPFDKIKIDRSFIDGVATNRHSAAIVRSTLILAASLDIPVLAEGVENAEHMTFLLDEGCQQVQGFYYGRPSPRADIEIEVNGPEIELPMDQQVTDREDAKKPAAA
ncbi:EAL domain-containing protein [Ciceribacter sp. L1K23]|uniref:putative bifunctional diguanylate cyclase/phosphodiesterase n=1 Tax=Ciceribacter sp. L1K23 TaxID=2820276 RepID=UPI001B81F3DE|nr:bifunctional diguanylate cyclase/phosphodiesterase [Ciceribacter sp. L1K23]MBR0554923.1 EAL domain-containing protein [Ciceribacter sp. L1K23]